MKRSLYFIAILLTLGVTFPIENALAQCQPDEFYGVVNEGNADAVVRSNSISNPTSSLGEPVLVPWSASYYAKLDRNSDYLVVDLTDTLIIGDTIWIYFGAEDNRTCELAVSGTLTGTDYSGGSDFFDDQYYTTNADLYDGSPEQDTVAFVISTGSVRYLRFDRWRGKPGVNGVSYSIMGCSSSYPEANNDVGSIYGEGTLNIDVQSNDSDPQDLALTTSIVNGPANGSAVVQPDNTINYTHDVGYVGGDNITYQVCNTSGLCTSATISITVTGATTISSGSYIINMGVTPQTVKNALKPYGLIYELTTTHYTPVDLIINPDKSKDGIDFSHNGTNYKGGSYIVRAEFIDATVAAAIASWESRGVVGDYSVSSIQVPVDRTINNFMGWTLDAENGAIAEDYILAAGFPSSAYNWLAPADLGGCNDVFVMPHADPTWDVHANLLTWNDSYENGGSKGTIWAACHAVSAMENLFDSSNPSDQMNFLSDKTGTASGSGDYADNSLILWDDHNGGTLPYSYDNHTHPEMQFMGDMDDATNNGSEEIFLPHLKWSDHTTISTFDPDHSEISGDQVAAVVAYGYAFGDTSRGQVMYMGGHDHASDWDSDNIAAIRAFFNFSFAASVGKSIKLNSSIEVDSILLAQDETQITMTAFGGYNVNYSYQWLSSCNGYFTQPDSATTVFIPLDTGQCVIRCIVSDDCGRSSFLAVPFSIASNICSAPSGENAIYGTVYQDLNANQIEDSWESGVPDVSVHLYEDFDEDGSPDGTAIETAITDASGDYSFVMNVSGAREAGQRTTYTYDQRVASGSDDASEWSSSGGDPTQDRTSSVVWIGDPSWYEEAGFRFQNVNIPAGSTITDAIMYVNVPGSSGASTAVNIRVERNANPVTFSSSNNIYDRTRSTGAIGWNINWSGGETNVPTPDLSAIIQEVVNSESGINDLVLILEINGSSAQEAEIMTFESGSAKAVRLVINYNDTGDGGGSGYGDGKHYITEVDASTFPYGGISTTSAQRLMTFYVEDQVKCYNKFGVDLNSTLAINDVNVTFQMLDVSGSVMRNDFDIEGDNATFGGFVKQDNSPGWMPSGEVLSGTNTDGEFVEIAGDFTFDSNGEYLFEPQSDFIGEVELRYVKCDDGMPVACDTGSLSIVVSAFPNPSDNNANSVISLNDYHVTYSDLISANLMDNDSDPEMDNIHLEEFSNEDELLPFGQDLMVGGEDRFKNNWSGAGRFKLLSDGNYSFTPVTGFVGSVELSYRICDDYDASYIACKDAKFTVEVMPKKDAAANDAPFAGDDYSNTIVNTPVIGKWLLNDTDDNGDKVKLNDLSQQLDLDAPGSGNILASYPTRKNGSVDLYDNGTYKYTPPTDYYGPDQLAYRICDVTASPACDSATIYLLTSPIYYDFGDLPAQYEPAGHMVPIDFDVNGTPDLPSSIWLGAIVDTELASQGNYNADGDNSATSNDEEGLVFPGYNGHWTNTTSDNGNGLPITEVDFGVIVNGSDPGMEVFYGLWIDWDFDGTFDDFYKGSGITNSWLLRNQDTIPITVSIPWGTYGTPTVGVRLRAFQSLPDASQFAGNIRAGEVEDYTWAMSSVLPVELTYFNVEPQDNDAILTWQTASEINSDYFSVQSSTDAINWEEIGTVEGNGNSTEVHNYNYIDKDLEAGRYYYRLQQFDFDGTNEFTDVRSVVIDGNGNVTQKEIALYPIPAHTQGSIRIDGLATEQVEVRLYSLDGSKAVSTQLTGDKVLDLNQYNLSTGTYLMNVIEDGIIHSKKIMLFE